MTKAKNTEPKKFNLKKPYLETFNLKKITLAKVKKFIKNNNE